MRTILASSMLQIVYAGTIPMTAAVVFRLLSVYDPFHWALASLAVGVHVYFVFLAKRLRVNEIARIDYRAEKDALFGELEQAKAISDEARRRAEEANIAKSRFLATMSHELRTPFNAILGFSEVMKAEMMGPLKNDTYKEYAGNIHDSGRHLLHLINEILDLSRIEAGRYELNEEPIQLIDIADDCLRLLKLRAESKGLELIEHLDEHLPQVWADERALRQIVLEFALQRLEVHAARRPHRVDHRHDRRMVGRRSASRTTAQAFPRTSCPRSCWLSARGRSRTRRPRAARAWACRSCAISVELHGGTFELRSQLRKGTEAIVFFPEEARAATHGAPAAPRRGTPSPSRETPGSKRRHRRGSRATATAARQLSSRCSRHADAEHLAMFYCVTWSRRVP